MKTLKLARLDLSVIDDAIDLIIEGKSSRTCTALERMAPCQPRYVTQWQKFNNNGSDTYRPQFPSWWNRDNTKKNKAGRLAALRAFRQAVFEAQTQSKTRSIKDLLEATKPHLKTLQDAYDVWEQAEVVKLKAFLKEINRALKA